MPRPKSWPSPWREALLALPMVLLLLVVWRFVVHAWGQGVEGLGPEPDPTNRLYEAAAWLSTPAIFLHMLAGAVITLLAPLQLVGGLRRRLPIFHRLSGYIVVATAVVAAIGGLLYIVLRGTVGGPPMDVAFAGYGLCLLVSAVQAARHARAGRLEIHREWALRTFVLAIGSWLYRLHYGLWYMTTGGLWIEPETFTGAFDRIQLVAFYVPYLLALELYLRAGRRRQERRALRLA
ncbi:MAG: DUF2306 domain-containing protein [Pseudomonadota bacterium]